ncbi:TPA: DnaJ domain-containing protein [Candidatus Woesearchaeota archaeon]|nr:DnaJ domain-containing protein [Candidatus Woesearchaeota archaeon]
MNRTQAFETLGLHPGASDSEIKSRYRLLAMKYHPDHNPGDDVAEEQFKEAAKAYEILTGETSSGQHTSLASLLAVELDRAQRANSSMATPRAPSEGWRYQHVDDRLPFFYSLSHPSKEKSDEIQRRIATLHTEDMGFVRREAPLDRDRQCRSYAHSLMYGITGTIPPPSIDTLAQHLLHAPTLEQMVATGSCARSIFRTEYSYGWKDDFSGYVQQWSALFYALLPHVKDPAEFPSFAKLAAIAQRCTKQKFGSSLMPPPHAIQEAAKIIVSALRSDFGLSPAIATLAATKNCLYHRIASMGSDIAEKLSPVWETRDELLDRKKYATADVETLFRLVNFVEENSGTRAIISSVERFVRYIHQLTDSIEREDLSLAYDFVASLAQGGRGYEREQRRQQCGEELAGVITEYLPFYRDHQPLFDQVMNALSRLKYDFFGELNTRPQSIIIPLRVAAFAGQMIVEEIERYPNHNDFAAHVHEVCSSFAQSELYPGRRQKTAEVVLVNDLSEKQQQLYTYLASVQKSSRKVTEKDATLIIPLLF